jgi:hypothetical protein
MDEIELHEFVLTFGYGQRLVPADSNGHVDNNAAGVSLADSYLIVHAASYDDAKAEVVRRFGQVWSQLYESREAAEVDRYGMWQLAGPQIVAREAV